MNEETKPLEKAAALHGSKLVGLTMDSLLEAAAVGGKVVVMAKAGHDLGAESARLLLRVDEQEIWIATASPVSLAAWLADDRVLAICSDVVPEVRLGQDSSADRNSKEERPKC